MFKVSWDRETGGVKLSALAGKDTISISPRPVFYEELNLLGLNTLGWQYPECKEPLLWACNKEYYYCGDLVFEAKNANIYDKATIVFQPGKEELKLKPVDMKKMLERTKEQMFLCESEAIEFIRDIYDTYSGANRMTEKHAANRIDFESLVERQEKKTKQKMAIVREDCESFDIMPLSEAEKQGKKVLKATKIDYFLASFSGGKDSQVVLDLCTRALPPDSFQVIYSDTGYELPSSIALYDEVQEYYHKQFPTLKFSTAKNHESVLNYWDKIGSPSDKHRWCCAVMKTAPLYRMLKLPNSNKQAKVLAFEGVRSEESVKRSSYERIGKGVKHSFVTNARPILKWNTTEIFLYLFRYNLTINEAYRMGKPRVGCIFCPFSSPWDDMVVNNKFKSNLDPFLSKIVSMAKDRKIPNIDEYVKERKWRLRASGNFVSQKSSVEFIKNTPHLVASISNAKVDIEKWLITISDYTMIRKGDVAQGEFNYNKKIYAFEINYKDDFNYTFTLYNASDIMLVKALKRVLYKTTYCISCEVCEVECPTGALSVYPEVKIDKEKCTHCHNCLDFHEHGCIVADSLVKSMENKTKSGNISKYGTFGIREEWLAEFFVDPQVTFWIVGNSSLGNKQIPSFKAWLKDAEIIDSKNTLTEFGQFCVENMVNDPELIWSLIWINIVYNSELVGWFANYAKPVTPGDNIALDEDDVVAITTRDLLEHCPLFMNENVNIGKKNSRALPDNDDKSFTSLITLYDTNRMIYTYYKSIRDHQKKVYNSTKIAGFLKFRPEQQDIDHFYNYLMDFWNMFINTFPGVKHYVDNCDDAKAASTYRNKEAGGLLYFRPIALPQLIKAIFETKFRTQLELNDCILKYAQIEMCISKEPWLNMLWDKEKQNMIMDYKTKICYMLIFLFSKEVLTQKEKNTLTKNFAEANHYDENMAKKKLHEMQSIV